MGLKIERNYAEQKEKLYFDDLVDGDLFTYVNPNGKLSRFTYIKDKANNKSFCLDLAYTGKPQHFPVIRLKGTLTVSRA